MGWPGLEGLLVGVSVNVEVVDRFEVERLRWWVAYVCGSWTVEDWRGDCSALDVDVDCVLCVGFDLRDLKSPILLRSAVCVGLDMGYTQTRLCDMCLLGRIAWV